MRTKRAVSALMAVLMTLSCIASVPVGAEDTVTPEIAAEETAEELPEADDDKYARIEYDEDNKIITKEIDGYFYELQACKDPCCCRLRRGCGRRRDPP